MAVKTTFLLCLFFVNFLCSSCLPEQTVWHAELSKQNPVTVAVNSLYNQTSVSVKLHCTPKTEGTDPELTIQWVLRYTACAEEYVKVGPLLEGSAALYLEHPEYVYGYNYSQVFYKKSELISSTCKVIDLPDLSEEGFSRRNATQPAMETRRKKRETETPDVNPSAVPPEPSLPEDSPGDNSPGAAEDNKKKAESVEKDVVYTTWRDGVYLFTLEVDSAEDFTIEATITMKGKHGHLSAIDWPLLPFYGSMCLVYVVFGLVWLVLSMCNWRDLLRIQFWIGGVIFLGMLEKAVYFAEYESINSTGRSVRGAVVFAELVSCIKRTVARMLVIIVSLGFGIVKPRLGPMLHKVLGIGLLYFILGSVEGLTRTLSLKNDTSRQQLFASIPLAVLDAAICWWIFTSLVQTTRTLRLRRNLVKLSLYRHFTNTLIFAVLASVAFMIWSLKQHKLAYCLTDWKEIWVDEAFWHMLFSLILLIIMILWRPTINNQRYAFSPLLDAADDEDEEDDTVMNDAFDGMKLRGSKNQNGSPSQNIRSKADDDLKWVEENIPSSVVDAALPALLDSDEEVVATQYERSKMQ